MNPPINLVNSTFLRELDLLTKAVDRDPSIGAVVLTGGGWRQFEQVLTSVLKVPAAFNLVTVVILLLEFRHLPCPDALVR
ncbi:hypothetical protein CQY20_23150 [Mycolicibacterium agri]|uniref:Uncharacterized protein n=1 Tax=Mycolicibacterium agri TaxID=36811 RepID=A0A2A7MTE2_MYCAG|nr:hypothetical protein [Mycolicibacterium agri]PEG35082.1 hypothetical protein CQY20_23150 [Mycolicibacterium agri]GFG53756.1 hypothetical protein MAGR_51970 [Mycolicibacterium agri]